MQFHFISLWRSSINNLTVCSELLERNCDVAN